MSQSPAKKRPERTTPLRVMFVITSMPVGGAETLLVNLIRRLDRQRFAPEVCCLKEPGPLGEELAAEIPVHARLLSCKYDLRILPRLANLFRQRKIDAIVTVGAGDKMFWGRLAAKLAGVPVICSALHSTGWPDGVSRLNRMLTPLTDAFIAVAQPHGQFLVKNLRFPPEKVRVIPNGVDTQRFCPRPECGARLRHELGIAADAPVAGIVAALRPEKHHALFVQTAALVRDVMPDARFVIVGDGPERGLIEALLRQRKLEDHVLMVGTRSDIPEVLAMLDAFVLTSHMEANPVSILEAMSTGLPVVSTNVGSVSESVLHGVTGYLARPSNAPDLADSLLTLFQQPELAAALGAAGRQRVLERSSLEVMVSGYEQLLEHLYCIKTGRQLAARATHEGTTTIESGLKLPALVENC